jgi:cysteinyl-tRNA synthetase
LRGRILILERKGSKVTKADEKLRNATKKAREGFEREMDNDFNTPGGLAELFDFVRTINTLAEKVGSASTIREALAMLEELLGILGIDVSTGQEFVEQTKSAEVLKGVIELLLELREKARQSKDFSMADMIRNRLNELGIVVADTKDGPTWKLA